MKAKLYGNIDKPVVAVIGSWDPLLTPHQQLFDQLSRYASTALNQSLVILIDPPPALFLNDSSNWQIYDDVKTRIALQGFYGVNGTLLINFERDDIDKSAATFLGYVQEYVQLSELWIGARQSLGPGPEGAFQAIERWTQNQGISMKLLTKVSFANSSLAGLCREVRQLLKIGRLAEAAKIVGRPPIWIRPESGKVTLSWHSGDYIAMPIDELGRLSYGSPICINLVAEDRGCSSFEWPDFKVKCLAFISGPADNCEENLKLMDFAAGNNLPYLKNLLTNQRSM
jgi:FAD synthase